MTTYTTIDSSPPERLGVEALFRSEGVAVARFLHRLGFAETDIPDLVQTVFLIAHQRGGFRPGPAKARTWLYSIAVRVSANERRKRRRFPLESGTARSELLDARTPETHLHHVRSLERVDRSLQKLDLLHRTAFVLYEVEGLSGQEVAEALDIPVGTVYRRVHVARQRFAQAHAEELDADDR